MDQKTSVTFLLLVLVQGIHSAEEYAGKLWVVFTPARYVTGLVSANHEKGFLIINIGLFVAGLLCWYWPVRKGYASAGIIIWIWLVIESVNGLGHIIWAINSGGYRPGVVTAPFLLVLSLVLGWQSLRCERQKARVT